MYKGVTGRIGLRRVLVLNLLCAALAVLYSVGSCESERSHLCSMHSATVMLTRCHDIVWLHRVWTTEAALLSFIFDLIGGGNSVRITMTCKCIADILAPENL